MDLLVAALWCVVSKSKFEIVTYNKKLFRGITDPWEKSKESPSHGFYGSGAYFVPEEAKEEATTWGDYIYEYKLKRPLKLAKHTKSFNGARPKRTDWLEQIPEDADGIWFGFGAEGADQILLRDFSLTKKGKKQNW